MSEYYIELCDIVKHQIARYQAENLKWNNINRIKQTIINKKTNLNITQTIYGRLFPSTFFWRKNGKVNVGKVIIVMGR